MPKETNSPTTLGQAIDQIIEALRGLDQHARTTAVQAACDQLKIHALSETATQSSATATKIAADNSVTEKQRRLTDIRALKQEKQPSSANEMAALVAFYLSEITPPEERKAEV